MGEDHVRPRPGGATIRRARFPFFREVTRALLPREVPGLDDDRVDDIPDTTLLVVSSSAFFEFLDFLEIPIEPAARLAAEAVERPSSPPVDTSRGGPSSPISSVTCPDREVA